MTDDTISTTTVSNDEVGSWADRPYGRPVASTTFLQDFQTLEVSPHRGAG
ncbi:MAG TPA: hypothetical protein VF481_07880 [Novosphingobium sp.]